MFIKILKVKSNNLLQFDNNSLKIFRNNNLISELQIPDLLKLKILKNKIILSSKNKKKLGLYVHLLSYNINYKLKKYKLKLIINGIGQKIKYDSVFNILNLKLGYSHDINLKVPDNINLKIIKSKEIILYSYDLIDVTQFASNLKKLKKVDPYKGKGILFKNEIILKKEGKKK